MFDLLILFNITVSIDEWSVDIDVYDMCITDAEKNASIDDCKWR